MDIKEFVNERKVLFWGVPSKEIENISEETIISTILSYGDWTDIQLLFHILDLNKVAKIFSNQINRPRNNYNRKTINYFTLYFNKYAQRNTI